MNCLKSSVVLTFNGSVIYYTNIILGLDLSAQCKEQYIITIIIIIIIIIIMKRQCLKLFHCEICNTNSA